MSLFVSNLLSRHPVVVILAAFLIIAAIRVTGPTDIYQGDQPKQADYVVDIVVRGNWLLQHHEDTVIASKPPLYNWLAAPFMFWHGKANDFLLKLPSLIAGLLTLLLIWSIGKKAINAQAGLYAALFLAATPMFAKQMYFARTDMLLVMLIAAQFWAIVHWITGEKRRWLLAFWAAGGLAFLTKGPVGVLIPYMGIAAWWLWEKRFREGCSQVGLRWGIPLMLLPTVLWVLAIILFMGHDVLRETYERLVVTETLNRFDPTSEPGETRSFFYYFLPTLARTAPWSLLGVIGFFHVPWRSFRKKTLENRGVVLALCWIVTTFVFLSLFPSKRIVRIFPLVPAICLLAGWVFDNFIQQKVSQSLEKGISWGLKIFIFGAGMLGLGICSLSVLGYFHLLTPDSAAGGFKAIVAKNNKEAMAISFFLVLASVQSFYYYQKHRKGSFVVGIVLAVMLGIMLDRHVVGHPAKIADGEYAKRIGNQFQNQVKSCERKSRAFLVKGYPYPLRYFAFHPGATVSLEAITEQLPSIIGEDVFILGPKETLTEWSLSKRGTFLEIDGVNDNWVEHPLTVLHFDSNCLY